MGRGRQHAVRARWHGHRPGRPHGDRDPDPEHVRLLEEGDGRMSDLLLQMQVDRLNADYCAALDEKRFDDWPEFFVEDGQYKVQARENFDRGLPLALIALESKGMMKDRVYGVTQTIYHGPYYMRHVVSPAQVLADEGERIRAQTHYAVFRT